MRSIQFVLPAAVALAILAGPMTAIAQVTTDRLPDERIDADLIVPVNLGATINSFSDEPQVAITHSGLSLYFSSDRPGGFGLLDIWVSHRTSLDAPWGEPLNLGPMYNGPKKTEFCPNFSPDDHWMFFPSGGGFGGSDIWMTFRLDVTDDFGWQTPINLGPSINTAFGEFDPYYFVDPKSGEATLYFISNRQRVSNGHGGFLFDIYQSTRNEDGSFQPAVLNKELSSPYDDRRMTIRRDGLLLIFTSDRPGGMGGLDLWISTRGDTHDPWGEPVNLGPPINGEADERGSALADDGVTLFFSSDRAGGFGQDDIWVTTFKRRDRNGGPRTPERN
jgi:hypothetical protein